MEYTRKQVRKAMEAWARDAYDDSNNENEYPSVESYSSEDEYVSDCVVSLMYYLED
jgi:hypothetical protein